MNWDRNSTTGDEPSPEPQHPMIGLHLASIDIADDEAKLTTLCGRVFMVHHNQDCCENVTIYDVKGEPQKLVGATVRGVEMEETNDDPEDYEIGEKDYRESWTWTNVTFHTNKGTVILRWLGESNGYYSESVDLDEITQRP